MGIPVLPIIKYQGVRMLAKHRSPAYTSSKKWGKEQAESSHSELQGRKTERCMALKAQSPPLVTYFLQQGHTSLTYPNSSTNWGQLEPMWDILIQTTTPWPPQTHGHTIIKTYLVQYISPHGFQSQHCLKAQNLF